MIFDAIQEWFQELLIDGIISNLTGMFDTLNTKVGEIAGEVGMTPSAWNSGIFNMVRSLSETVIIPIASIVLTFVMLSRTGYPWSRSALRFDTAFQKAASLWRSMPVFHRFSKLLHCPYPQWLQRVPPFHFALGKRG